MNRNIKSFFIILALILTAFLTTGCEESKSIKIMEENGFYYRHKFGNADAEAEILGYYGDDVSTLVIPETIGGMTVVSVRGDEVTYVFSDDVVTDVKVPPHSFANCKGLASVVLPDSITTIGENAFNGCENLESIEIPEGVTEIGTGAFRYCKSLQSIEIPERVTEIKACAFMDCESLQSITMSDTVSKIGSWAFAGCEEMTSLVTPDNVTIIGEFAFYKCKKLRSIEISEGVTEIGKGAFSYCKDLTAYFVYNSYIKDYMEEYGIEYTIISKDLTDVENIK